MPDEKPWGLERGCVVRTFLMIAVPLGVLICLLS